MKLQDIESSFFRYLYENLEVAESIKVFESIYLQDFDSFTKWCVIDSLSNSMNAQPVQLYFLHCSVQKAEKNQKEVLIDLVDKVYSLVSKGTRITVYDYPSEDVIGELEVTKVQLGPVLQHAGGGALRSITVAIAHEATY